MRVPHGVAGYGSTLIACSAVMLAAGALWGQAQQSPREAALAIIFADKESTLDRYLLESTKQEMKRLDSEAQQFLRSLLMFAQSVEKDGYKVLNPSDASRRLVIQGPDSTNAFEITLEKEEVTGEQALLEAKVHRRDSAPIAVGVRLQMEKGSWRLVGIDLNMPSALVSALGQLDSPGFVEKVEEALVPRNETVVVSRLRSLTSAIRNYWSDWGLYPKNLAALHTQEPLPYVDEVLASGEAPGYVILYLSEEPHHAYTLEAHPKVPGKTGNRFFFVADGATTIRVETGKRAGPKSPTL